MRWLIVALLICGVHPAQAGWCDYQVPPLDKRAEPTVEYYSVAHPLDELEVICGVPANPFGMIGGCVIATTSPDVPAASPDVEGELWIVYHRDDLNDAEYECVMLHEKAHMPPNNWDHGPTWRSYLSENKWRPAPGPRWRRPSHVDPFMFVRGRVGLYPG